MVNEEFKDMFVVETKKDIKTLKKLIIDLKKERDIKNIISDTHRCFHTLKGNSATMGYEKFSNIAKNFQDLLDMVKKDEIQVTPNLLDLISEGYDILSDGLKMIIKDTPEIIEDEIIIKKLETLLQKK